MLSEQEFNLISISFKLASRLYFVPFEWDETVGTIQLTQQNFKRFISKIVSYRAMFYSLTLLLRLFPATNDWFPCEREIEKGIFHGLLTMAYIASSTESICLNYYSSEAAFLFKQLTLLNRKLGK
jgi:hypothetical protein